MQILIVPRTEAWNIENWTKIFNNLFKIWPCNQDGMDLTHQFLTLTIVSVEINWYVHLIGVYY